MTPDTRQDGLYLVRYNETGNGAGTPLPGPWKIAEWDSANGEWISYKPRVRQRQAPMIVGPHIPMPDEQAAETPAPSGVWIDPQRQAGLPCINGTRIPIHLVLRALALHADLSGVSTAYPGLTVDNAKDALWFACEKLRPTEQETPAPSPEETAHCPIHGSFYSGYAECPTCKQMEDAETPAPEGREPLADKIRALPNKYSELDKYYEIEPMPASPAQPPVTARIWREVLQHESIVGIRTQIGPEQVELTPWLEHAERPRVTREQAEKFINEVRFFKQGGLARQQGIARLRELGISVED